MALLIVALLMFAGAAVVGATMAVRRFGDKPISMQVALTHGAFAALGLVLLIVAAGRGTSGLAIVALVLFLAAALGGFYLFSIYLRKKPLPIPVMLVHASAAVTAFLLLLIATAR